MGHRELHPLAVIDRKKLVRAIGSVHVVVHLVGHAHGLTLPAHLESAGPETEAGAEVVADRRERGAENAGTGLGGLDHELEREVAGRAVYLAFILATPSDNPGVPDNDDQGIWFLTTPGPMPGFQSLPDLGPSWVYAGWAVDVSDPNMPVPYSTGTFSMASGADSDAAGCTGGGPPFPGQDFVAFQCGPVLDLDSGAFAAVITIEPVPDNSAGPFQLKPLASAIPTDALGMSNPMTNQAMDTFPTGLATLHTPTVPVNVLSWGELKNIY